MKSCSIKLVKTIFSYLNDHARYAVLRNYEKLPEGNTSRDIDMIIHESDWSNSKRELVDIIVNNGWSILSFLNNGRLITYICAKIEGDDVEILQFDFFLHTSVHGVVLATADELLKGRIFTGEFYHVTKSAEFLDKYLYNVVVGASYPEAYRKTRDAVIGDKVVRDKLLALFGSSEFSEIESRKRGVLLHVFRKNILKNPIAAFSSVVRSMFFYLYTYLKSDVALSFSFTGPDGAGKTTVIDEIKKELSPVYGKATEYFHFRPLLFPNLGEVGSSVGILKEVDRDFSTPHRGTRKGRVSSLIRLFYYTLDYTLGFWFKVKKHCRISKLVVFDRYYTDVIVDSRRSSIYLPTSFLFYWGRFFVPCLGCHFLLTADTDVIMSRKQELKEEGVLNINRKINYLSSKRGYHLIYNNGAAHEAKIKVIQILLDVQHRKNLMRACRGF